MTRRIRPTAVALVTCAALACTSDNLAVNPRTKDALFYRYVALGNSITAGFQSGGINDSTQRESYAYYVAQAAATRYAYASLAKPGCPPPIANFVTQQRVGPPINPPCALRDVTKATATLNNVAVPGANVADPTSRAGNSVEDALATFILGGETQVERALETRPTFVSVWLGNNDILIPGLTGLLTPTPSISPGLPDPAVFKASLDATLTALTTGAPGLRGVLIGVVDVSNAPVLFPAQALQNPAFKAGLDQGAGTTLTIDPNCSTAPGLGSRISLRLIAEIRAGNHPPYIGCRKNSIPGTLVGDIFVLDVEEQAALTATVATINANIQSKATALKWAYVDVNPVLVDLRASGAIPPVPILNSPNAPFGEFVSLDGVHPARKAHQKVANLIIQAIKATYNIDLGTVPIQ
ncbi:MAG: SGNH/GDSL hydrolase family protein [Gemmatimonadaceae bacterium]